MITSPPAYTLENAWKILLTPAAISAGILPANVFLSQANTTILHPCLKITTSRVRESKSVGPGSGIFESLTSIKYETKLAADQQSQVQANKNFEYIIQALYWGGNPFQQTLALRLTQAYAGQFNCYAVKNLEIANAVVSLDKIWTFEIQCECWFINRSNP